LYGAESTGGYSHNGGIWGDTGGLVGFFNGSVKWLESLILDPLQRYDGGGPTANPWEAINPAAKIFDHRGSLNADGSSSPGGGGGSTTPGGELDDGNGDDFDDTEGDDDEGTGDNEGTVEPIPDDTEPPPDIIPEEPPDDDTGGFKFGEMDWGDALGGNGWDDAVARAVSNGNGSSGGITHWGGWTGSALARAATCLLNSFLSNGGGNTVYATAYQGNMNNVVEDLVAAAGTVGLTLPDDFGNLVAQSYGWPSVPTISTEQLEGFKSALSDEVQTMTDDDRADYNRYLALYTEFLPEMKETYTTSADAADARDATNSYLNENLTGHATPTKGNVLALATLAVDLESSRR
jgi:hypothetical protein